MYMCDVYIYVYIHTHTTQAYKSRIGEVQLNRAEELIGVLKQKLADAEERVHAATANLRKEKQR